MVSWNSCLPGTAAARFICPPRRREASNNVTLWPSFAAVVAKAVPIERTVRFDPDFDARVQPVPGSGPGMDDSGRRWDGANLQAFAGTYGDYVTGKVGKVFPALRRSISGP